MAPRRSTLDWILECLAALALIVTAGMVAVHWPGLQSRIPIHFGLSGDADAWGEKTAVVVMPIISVGMYVLLTAASYYQRLINLPIAVDRDAPEVRRLLLSLSIVLKAIVLLIFFYIERAVVKAGLGHPYGLGKLFLPIALLAVFVPLTWYLIKLRRYRLRA